MSEISLFWFRRDLRLFDNRTLHEALKSELPVLCIFIFDAEILSKLKNNDPRVTFIYEKLKEIDGVLKKYGTSLLILYGVPLQVHRQLKTKYNVVKVYFNEDYEPYSRKRDKEVKEFYEKYNSEVYVFKDQVIFRPGEVLKDDGKPYTVFTPYKKKWLSVFEKNRLDEHKISLSESSLLNIDVDFPNLKDIGFEESEIKVKPFKLKVVKDYNKQRDFPSQNGTSLLGPHLRFGTVSIRKLTKLAIEKNQIFLSELIWREFFMQILCFFPHVVDQSFRKKYDTIRWENDETQFKAWCEGKTGFPMVDAGMRELNETGYMHNRVRMVVASFLCKHLLIDWRWGEAYFAEKLLDFELASNNGNWQWAAGTGCDAAPYFRVFNPTSQQQKFDKEGKYIKKWLPELNSLDYPLPIVEHKKARNRAIERYKKALT